VVVFRASGGPELVGKGPAPCLYLDPSPFLLRRRYNCGSRSSLAWPQLLSFPSNNTESSIMPAVIHAWSATTPTRPFLPRDAPYFTSPPLFPPFRPSDDGQGGGGGGLGPFRIDPDDDRDDGHGLSPAIIAAIVVSIVVFIALLIGLVALLVHRRRKARKVNIAMKEENVSVTAVTASGALDPPPPYDAVHQADANRVLERARRWDSQSSFTRSEEEEQEEEDQDALGSHATITDGMEPGRHGGPTAAAQG